MSLPENQLNTQALPNPWAPASNTRQTSPSSQPESPANPFAALGGGGGLSSSPFFSMNPTNSGTSGNQNNPTPATQSPPLWMNPDFMQFSMRMQQMMQQPSQTEGATGNTTSTPFPMFNPFGMTPPSTINTTPSQPPEQRFASQITQLEEMGFSERDRNVRALLATGGDVQAAIEYLLSQ
jgi:ubiquilin